MLITLALFACSGPGTTDSDPGATDSDPAGSQDSGLVDDTGPFDSDGDGIQDNLDCDPDDPDIGEGGTWYADGDGDGYGDPDTPVTGCEQPADSVDNADDCDDTSDQAVPGGGIEVCDGVDNDCNGAVDDSDDWATIPGTYENLSTGILNWETDDVMCLQPGTHDPVVTLSGKEFTLIGADRDTTFISGLGSQHAVYNSGSVVTLEALTLIEGYPSSVNGGAALFSSGGFLTLRDVAVDGIGGTSEATLTGVAMQLISEHDIDGLEVRNLDIDTDWDVQGVVAVWQGGGVMRNVSLRDNSIQGRQLYGPLAVWEASEELEDIDLIGNTYVADASVSGAGLFVQTRSDVTAKRVRVLDTVVEGVDPSGGALVSSYQSSLAVENVVIAGLDSGATGIGPMALSLADAELTVTNATLVDNRSGLGALGYFRSTGSSQALFTNVVAAWNTAEEGYLWYGNADEAYIRSDYYVLFENDSTDGADKSGTFDSGPWYGGNGAATDPLFVDMSSESAADWDLHVQTGSDAIDAGDPSIQDADGTTSDIGAYGGPNAWE